MSSGRVCSRTPLTLRSTYGPPRISPHARHALTNTVFYIPFTRGRRTSHAFSLPTSIRQAAGAGGASGGRLPGIRLALAAATVLLVTQGVVLTLLIDSRQAKTQLEAQLAENNQRLSSSEASVSTLQERLRSESEAKERREVSSPRRGWTPPSSIWSRGTRASCAGPRMRRS